MTSDELRKLVDGDCIGLPFVTVRSAVHSAADEIDRLQIDRQSLIDELSRVRDIITGQEDYDIVTQLLKDMGENTGGDE